MNEFSVDVHETEYKLLLSVDHGVIQVGNSVVNDPSVLWDVEDGELVLEANETSARVIAPWAVGELPEPVVEDVALPYRMADNAAYIDATFENTPITSFYVASGEEVYEVRRGMADDTVEGDELLGIEAKEGAFTLQNIGKRLSAPMEKQKVLDLIGEGTLAPVVRVAP